MLKKALLNAIGLLPLLASAQELGLGSFVNTDHLVAGDVFVISERIFEIRNFQYDGQGPAVYWWIDKNSSPTEAGSGILSPDNNPSCEKRLGFSADGSKTLRVEIPQGESINDYLGGSLSVWCEQFGVSFGHVEIPSVVQGVPEASAVPAQCDPPAAPREISVGSFVDTDHLVSGDVFIVSERVFEIRNFQYDGQGPAVYWWIDDSSTPTVDGASVLSPDNVPSCEKRLGFSADGTKTVTVEVAEGKTVNDYLGGSLSVWCEQFGVSFGHVTLPSTIDGVAEASIVPAQCDAPASAPSEVSLGKFMDTDHLVDGEVFIVSERVFEIRNFMYDGQGPQVYWWIDAAATPTTDGKGILSPNNVPACEKRLGFSADGTKTVRVELPPGKSVNDYTGGSLAVWCDQFEVSFGHVTIPSTVTGIAEESAVPLQCEAEEGSFEISVGAFVDTDHLVSGDVFILSERVIEVRNFMYDGQGPAVYWWIDEADSPTVSGKGLLSPDNQPACEKRLGFSAEGSKTVRIELPEGNSIKDYLGGSFSVWCDQFGVSFGHVTLPATIDGDLAGPEDLPLQCAAPSITETPEGFNCEELSDELQVRWRVVGDALEIDLLGKIGEDDYMSFGRSGSDVTTDMIGADVVVADIKNGVYRARDLYMNSRSQCSGGQGVCPDGGFTFIDDITSVSGSEDLGLTQIRYTRPLVPSDVDQMANGQPIDREIPLDEDILIAWAIGPVNQNNDFPAFHRSFSTRDAAKKIMFGREVVDNCDPLIDEEVEVVDTSAFERPVITADTTELFASIGPSGGERGFEGISGRTPWGIAWYINGDLIPVIQMRRGTTYTIYVNGGDDPSDNARYHPMYLTSDELGGYAQKSPLQRAEETVYAGIFVPDDTAVSRQGVESFEPTAAGPICRLQSSPDTAAALTDLSDYNVFLSTLDTSCKSDEAITANAGILEFTPDESTPDLIYYQCVTHANLGWKIEILDADEEESADDTTTRDEMDTSSATKASIVGGALLAAGLLL